jgi:PAS domain S-box-containing protein
MRDMAQTITFDRAGHVVRITGAPAAAILLLTLVFIVGVIVWFVRLARHARSARGKLSSTEAALRAEQDVVRQSRREGASMYQILFERHPVPMWIYDQSTLAIVESNEAAAVQYGYTRDELRRMTIRDLRPEAERNRLDAMLAQVRSDVPMSHSARHRRKDGTELDVEVLGYPIDIDGRALRLVVAADVSERLAAQAALAATNKQLQLLIDAAPQAIVVIDEDWRIARWNRAAEKLFGWSRDEVLGQEAPFIPDDERLEAYARQLASEEQTGPRLFEAARVRKDGRRIDLLVATAPLETTSGERSGFIAVYTDLTERKQLEDQLRQAQKMEAIGTLAGGIAHDFNNILTVISSYASLLIADDRYPEIRPDLQEIAAAAQRATGLTRQLLTFSRRAIVRPQPLDLNNVIRGMQPLLERVLMSHIELSLAFGQHLGIVTADASQIEQILLNLVVNAGDAMPDGGTLVIETKNVELDEAYASAHAGVRPGTYVLLAVSDTGVGIDPAIVEKIFEPFFTTKDVGRGTGLGLATVYAIVKQLGGHIWVYSEPGAGASFKVYLPSEPALTVPGAPPVRRERAVATGTVLLVEDDDAVRRATRMILERAGFVVLEAAGGEEALKLARSHGGAIDVVVTDLMMPHMSGGDFARALATTHPALRVVFVSGYTDDSVVRRGLIDAEHTFLQKPFTADQLVDVLTRFARQARVEHDDDRAT